MVNNSTSYRSSQTYYQYTSESGFKGIIENKAVWFSDITQSNDPRELNLGPETLKNQVVESLLSNMKGPTSSKMEHEIHGLIEGMSERNYFFVSCFTPLCDSRKMWREYGAAGRGLSLGFRDNVLDGFLGGNLPIFYTSDPGFSLEARRNFVNNYIDFFKKFSGNEYDFRDKRVTELLVTAITCTVKDEVWAHEREHRVAFVQNKDIRTFNAQRILMGLRPDTSFEVFQRPNGRSGTDLTPYIIQPLRANRRGDISHNYTIRAVWIGPKCELSSSDVQELLQENGFRGFEIIKSRVLDISASF